MRKIRVLLLLNELSLTGAPKIALDTFGKIRDEVELRILSMAGGPFEERCRELGPLQLLEDLPGWRSLTQRAQRRAVREWWQLSLRRWKPDLIYVNSVAALPIAKTLELPGVPVLLHVHEMGTVLAHYAGECPETLREWPQRYIAVSGPVRHALVSDYGIDAQKVATIHEFINEGDWAAGGEVRPVPPNERLVVGGAGTVEWRKGTTLWLQMAAELKKLLGEDRVRFVWVGVRDNDAGRQFRETARKLKVDSLLECVPLTKEPLRHFAGFDVFAMTSWEDPCPIVVLENMMLRKPVVCFAGSGGAAEEVGETGVVVEDFSPRAMAEALAALACAPERRAALGEAARARVTQCFTASVQVPKIHEEIEKLVSHR